MDQGTTTIHKALMAFALAVIALILARFGYGDAPSAESIGQLLIELIGAVIGALVVAGGVWWQKNHPTVPPKPTQLPAGTTP